MHLNVNPLRSNCERSGKFEKKVILFQRTSNGVNSILPLSNELYSRISRMFHSIIPCLLNFYYEKI